MCEAIMGANMDALDASMKLLRGQYVEAPAPLPAIKPKVRDGAPFSQAAEAYMAELDRDRSTRLRDHSRRQYQKAFRLFADYSHDASLAAVDRKMASSFLNTIAKLHPNWGQHHKSKAPPLSELLKQFGRGNRQLSNASLNHYPRLFV